MNQKYSFSTTAFLVLLFFSFTKDVKMLLATQEPVIVEEKSQQALEWELHELQEQKQILEAKFNRTLNKLKTLQ
jgi:hypothetical protein